MAYLPETIEQRDRRIRTGRWVAFISVSWWVAAIGGVIFNLPAA